MASTVSGQALCRAWVGQSFPDVPSLTTQELADQLASSDDFSPIVLDARKNEEFTISHLLNAHHARDVATLESPGMARDHPITLPEVYSSTTS